MKTKQVLTLIVFILFTMGWLAPVWAQDIPTNYIQNPNMEHELNAIFWYGSWDPVWGSDAIAWNSSEFLSNETSHSGNWSLYVPPGCWIWVSYPVRGHEEKTFKASFWYKGYMSGYWNFIYRDVGMTEDDLPPDLAEYVGADTCYHEMGGQNALRFVMGGEDGYTEDWTYFEFVWDFPGTIPGWGNTSMWYGENDPAYVDDLYYGEWYDDWYEGEEPFGFINGDFEKDELNGEWLYNLASWDAFRPMDFLSTIENHTDLGFQSIGLQDYKVVDGSDTSDQDRNVTYYLPALGGGGKNMELSFWYKGNEATMDLYFYKNYGVNTDVMPVPAGAQLRALEVIPDTVDSWLDSTIVYDYLNPISTDTAHLLTIVMPEVVGFENFDNVTGTPELLDWNWSGNNFFGYNDWNGQITDVAFYSTTKSLWLPGDPKWSGAEGTLPDIVDGGSYALSFMFKGKMQLVFKFSDLKYDLANDPDNIVPPEAEVNSAKRELLFNLSSEGWREFEYRFEVGTWLADSGITTPTGLRFDLVGTYTLDEVGYVDDLEFGEVTVPVDVLAKQSFDGLGSNKPYPLDWNWSDGHFFGYNDWDGEMVEDESYSNPTSLWLPTDAGWTGTEGTISNITDSAAYSISFMYKGNLKLSLDLGADLKYDLEGDPDGIIPPEAEIDGGSLLWELTADNGWKKFSYAWEQGSWLADSGVTSPANLTFLLWDSELGDGWVDDLMIMKTREKLGTVSLIESSEEVYLVFGIDTIIYETIYEIEYEKNEVIVDADSDFEPLAVHWTLPAVSDWTQWKYNWTNPSGDIGGNLTMFLDNAMTSTPDFITDTKTTFDPDNNGWTFFDDFEYQIVTGISNRSVMLRALHVYPNPAVDNLYLSLEIPLRKIEVFDVTGQKVKVLMNPDRVFNVSDLTSGIYLLHVYDEEGAIHVSKFIRK